MSRWLLELFKNQHEVDLPHPEDGLRLGVLNRVYPMTQAIRVNFTSPKSHEASGLPSARDIEFNHLHNFYQDTGKAHLSRDDIYKIQKAIDPEKPDMQPATLAHMRRMYSTVLKSYGKKYHAGYDHLRLATVAGVLRHASSAKLLWVPSTVDVQPMYKVDRDSVDWQAATFEAKKLIPEELSDQCTPEVVRKIWDGGFISFTGISRRALIEKNANFLLSKFTIMLCTLFYDLISKQSSIRGT